MALDAIPFNKFYLTGKELTYIKDSLKQSKICGDNKYTKLSERWLEENLKTKKAMLTPSCTSALEMSALLIGIKPGDEIIMPSFTFVSTANAFVLNGGIPVFVDIRPDTQNIDENLIEKAITEKTKAIVVVHYAGIACNMDKIMKLAKKHNLYVIEDAAHSILSKYNDTYLGTIGDIGTLSFHDTKNITCGEGGAILINNSDLIERAEIIREKGTNRSKFFRGQVDKYTWVDLGSSYLQSEMNAAFLLAQLENAKKINHKREKIWNTYYKALKPLAKKGLIKVPEMPEGTSQNGHLFYILLENQELRANLITHLKDNKISTVFHYVPLHNSPAGVKFSKTPFNMDHTEKTSDTLLRLPLYADLKISEAKRITKLINEFLVK